LSITQSLDTTDVGAAAKRRRGVARGHAKPIEKELLRVDAGVMAGKAVIFASLLALGYAGILAGGVVGAVLGTILVGAMFAHGVELTHQFLHGTGFRGRGANRVAGFLCALPMFVSHSHYKALHLAHHRNLGTPANHEFFNYGNVKGKHFLVVLARSFSPARFVGVAKNIVGALLGRRPEGAGSDQEARAIQVEYLGMLACVVAAAAFTAITRSDLVLRLWVWPLLLVAEPVHFWVELPEHFGCDLTTRNGFLNTRTIRGSWLSFWFTNGNNFHVEHHLYPRVAIDKLPKVHANIRHDIKFFNPSYWSFLRLVLAREESPDGAAAAVTNEEVDEPAVERVSVSPTVERVSVSPTVDPSVDARASVPSQSRLELTPSARALRSAKLAAAEPVRGRMRSSEPVHDPA
jgi:fatty acid desaturase